MGSPEEKKMKLTEVKIILKEIEDSCNVNLITIDGLKAWPLIRSILWSEFAKADVQKTSVLVRGYSFTQIVEHLLNKFGLIHLVTKITPKIVDKKTDVLFIGRAQHRVRIKGIRRSFDRIMDPLVHLSDTCAITKSFTLGTPKLRNSYNPTKRLWTRRSVPELKILGLEESGIPAYVNQLDISIDSFWSAVRLGVKTFSKSYVMGSDLLSKVPNTKRIFLSVWYSLDSLGVIAAAHQRNIQVIDFQHGGEMHGMYAGWGCIPENGYELLPDIFWCWGDESANRIQHGMKKSSKHRTVIGGYPWQEFRQTKMSESIDKPQLTTPTVSTTKVVLFSLQPLSFDVQKRIPDFILEFLKLDHPEIYFKFRRHPNDPDDKEELGQLRKMKLKTYFEIEDSSADLVATISGSNFHISAFSSVAFECLALGVPSLLFGEQSKVLYDREIQEGVFSWTTGDIDTLSKFFEGEIESNSSPRNYISTSLDLARNTLLEIIHNTNHSNVELQSKR